MNEPTCTQQQCLLVLLSIYLGLHSKAGPRVQLLWIPERSTNDKLRILVKAQPSTQNTLPRSPTRLGIRLRDLGLLNKYSLGHCGFSAASTCIYKLAFTSRHYALLAILTLQHSTKLLCKPKIKRSS